MTLPLPRPVLLAVAGLVLVTAAFLATRGGGAEEGPGTAPPLTAPSGLDRGNRADRGDRAPADSGAADRAAADKKAINTPARPRRDAAATLGLPLPVARALTRRKVTVLFIAQRGPADDTATRRAVRRLKREPGVAVFADKLANIDRYRRITTGLGVSRVPSVVIVDRRRQARLVEGFVDDASLRQLVRDARR